MKKNRQSAILNIIETEQVATQEELVAKLKTKGIFSTQATVSRDIKELKLLRDLSSNGKYFYTKQGKKNEHLNNRNIRLFSDSFVSAELSEATLVIKTVHGGAGLIAETISGIQSPYIIGTLAGHDIVLVIIKNKEKVEEIKELIYSIIK